MLLKGAVSKGAGIDNYLTKTISKIEAKKTRNQAQSPILNCERHAMGTFICKRKKSAAIILNYKRNDSKLTFGV